MPVARRAFVYSLAVAMLARPRTALAQQTERPRSVGILMPLREDDPQSQLRIAAFSQILRQIGWMDGRTIALEKRFSDGDPERLAGLALDLVQKPVDVIVTQAAQPVEAVRKATTSIPIVMASVGDAVGAGYVGSLAHPGGNITGLTLIATDQSAKRLQLVKELVPAAARVAALTNANASGHRLAVTETGPAAAKLGLAFQSLAVKTNGDIDGALAAAAKANVQAIITMDDPLIQSARARIVEFQLNRRLPVIGELRPMTEASGVMSYGPNQIDMWKRAAIFVDKILKGANPADIPVERPTKFELLINLKSAKALGLPVPNTLLVAADEVIE